MARAHTLDACLRCESILSTLPIQLLSSPPPAWLFGPHHSPEQACFYKAAVKRGESRYGRSWGLFRRSKILHHSVYSALWLGGLRCQCRRQTNGPLTALCPCVMVLGKKKKIIKSVGPFSASAHRENARYARFTSPALAGTHTKLTPVCLNLYNIFSVSMKISHLTDKWCRWIWTNHNLTCHHHFF